MKSLLVLIALSGCASWSKRDMALEGVFLAAQTADMLQTFTITKQCQEANPIEGECGQHVSPQIYMPVTAIVHFLIADALPEKYRGTFLGLSVGVEATVVYRNYLDDVPFYPVTPALNYSTYSSGCGFLSKSKIGAPSKYGSYCP